MLPQGSYALSVDVVLLGQWSSKGVSFVFLVALRKARQFENKK